MRAAEVADLVRQARTSWEAASAPAAAALGQPAAVAGYERMRQAWSAQLAAQEAVLRRLAEQEAGDVR